MRAVYTRVRVCREFVAMRDGLAVISDRRRRLAIDALSDCDGKIELGFASVVTVETACCHPCAEARAFELCACTCMVHCTRDHLGGFRFSIIVKACSMAAAADFNGKNIISKLL